MALAPFSSVPSAPELWVPDACRRLAARVIDQAFRDAFRPGGLAANRESARDFLVGSAMLHYWCDLAGLDHRRVTAYARSLLPDCPRRSQRPRLRA